MALESMNGLWLPLGAGMMISQLHADRCKVFSTKSRCPCLMEFEAKGARHTAVLYKRVKRKPFLDAPSHLSQPSFWAWLCSWFCLGPQPSVDVEPFPSRCVATEAVIDTVVDTVNMVNMVNTVNTVNTVNRIKSQASAFRVMVKTHEAMYQEEMAAHLIDEVPAR